MCMNYFEKRLNIGPWIDHTLEVVEWDRRNFLRWTSSKVLPKGKTSDELRTSKSLLGPGKGRRISRERFQWAPTHSSQSNLQQAALLRTDLLMVRRSFFQESYSWLFEGNCPYKLFQISTTKVLRCSHLISTSGKTGQIFFRPKSKHLKLNRRTVTTYDGRNSETFSDRKLFNLFWIVNTRIFLILIHDNNDRLDC